MERKKKRDRKRKEGKSSILHGKYDNSKLRKQASNKWGNNIKSSKWKRN